MLSHVVHHSSVQYTAGIPTSNPTLFGTVNYKQILNRLNICKTRGIN